MSLKFNSLIQKMFVMGLLVTACQSKKPSAPSVDNKAPVAQQPIAKESNPTMQREFDPDERNKYPVKIIFNIDDKLDFRIERLPSSGFVNVYHAADPQKPINKRISLEAFDKVFDQLIESGYLKYDPFLAMTHGDSESIKRYTLNLECGGFKKTVTYDSGTKLEKKFAIAVNELTALASEPNIHPQPPIKFKAKK